MSLMYVSYAIPFISHYQKKMRGQKGTLPVHALGYVNSTKGIYRLALEQKGVFRDVRRFTVWSMLNSVFRYKQLVGGHIMIRF